MVEFFTAKFGSASRLLVAAAGAAADTAAVRVAVFAAATSVSAMATLGVRISDLLLQLNRRWGESLLTLAAGGGSSLGLRLLRRHRGSRLLGR